MSVDTSRRTKQKAKAVKPKFAMVAGYDGDICLVCRQEARVVHHYQCGDMTMRDDYCGQCGANWGLSRLRPVQKVVLP